jgi:hypothetical protein
VSEPLTVEPDRVIMRGDWATEIIHDVAWSETENIDAFKAEFEIDSKDHLRAEDYYQVITFMRVIKRKSDGRLFGYPFDAAPGNYAMEVEDYSNGEDHGFEYEWDAEADDIKCGQVWVWLPAEPFVITGYRIQDCEATQ